MDIDLLAGPADLLAGPGRTTEKKLKGKVAVVFDVLRATSTIVTALANGCRAVIPAEEIAEAAEIARALKEGRYPARPTLPRLFDRAAVLLGGERGGERVPAFPYGNSPLEYTRAVVENKVLVLTTTNGTRAIRRAAQGAQILLLGSLLNARAVAVQLWQLRKDAVLVCAGTNGEFSLEDALAAGVVIAEMLAPAGEKDGGKVAEGNEQKKKNGNHPGVEMINTETVHLSDSALAAYRLALGYGDNVRQALTDSRHGQRLLSLGRADDLHFCARRNLFSLVPVYRQGIIYPA